MSGKGKEGRVPQIRFAGFTDPWEHRKLGELCTFAKGHGYSKADIRDTGTPLILYGRLYTQYESRIEEVDTFAVEQEGSLLSKGVEVIVPASGETAEDIAVAASVRRSGIILGGDLNVVTPGESLDPDYTAIGITYGEAHEDLAKRAQGKSVVHVHGDDIANVEFAYPAIEEQRAISSLVLNLDSLITLHQRKYDKLCEVKKSMLDKMFPKGGSLYPEIRFAGFTDPWEQRKLGELARRVTRKNTERESDLPLTISAQYGLIDQRVFFNNQVASKDMSGYFLLRKGEFAYNKSTSSDSPWGAIKRLVKYDKGCVSTLYICFELLESDPDYLVTYYETNRWHNAVQLIAAEGARNHGLLNIAPDDFFETQLTIPSNRAEQARIGSCFMQLDHLITLHQRKLELLRNIKRAMLDKMFA